MGGVTSQRGAKNEKLILPDQEQERPGPSGISHQVSSSQAPRHELGLLTPNPSISSSTPPDGTCAHVRQLGAPQCTSPQQEAAAAMLGSTYFKSTRWGASEAHKSKVRTRVLSIKKWLGSEADDGNQVGKS